MRGQVAVDKMIEAVMHIRPGIRYRQVPGQPFTSLFVLELALRVKAAKVSHVFE
jgi:hypothetical protein